MWLRHFALGGVEWELPPLWRQEWDACAFPDSATVGPGLSRSAAPAAERGLGRQDLVPPTQEG